MDRSLKEQLRALKSQEGRLSPDRLWVAKARTELLERIELQSQGAQRDRLENITRGITAVLPLRLRAAVRPVFTFALVALVSVAGWIASVSASFQSLPGDTLYGVKIATEKTQIAIAGIVGADKKAEVLSSVAKTRVYEAKQLIAQNKLEHVDETLANSVSTLEEASKTAEDAVKADPSATAEVVGQLTDAADVIAETLDDVLEDIAVDENEGTDDVLEAQLGETIKDVTEQGIETVKFAVENQDELAIDEEVVEQLVLDVIDEAAEGQAEVESDLEALQEVSSEELTEDASALSDAETDSAEESTEATADEAELDEQIEEEAAEAVEQIEGVTEDATEASEFAEEGIEQAKQLVEDGQLLEALEKAQEVNEATVEIKQEVIDAQQEVDPEQVVQEAKDEIAAQQQAEQTSTTTEAIATESTPSEE